MKSCFLFPGQGAQYPGMAKDLWEASPKVRELFELASEASGMDTRRLLFEGTAEELKVTDKTQVAVTLASVSASAVLKEKGVAPEGCAGFSLGEYSALFEAGVLGIRDLFAVVKKRGELMEKAARRLDEASGAAGTGRQAGMAAVIGLGWEQAASALRALEEGGEKGAFLANFSSPQQIVLAGTADGLDKAEAAFKEAGAKRFVRLKVSAPFHCPLLEEARLGLKEFIQGISFGDPKLPVYANVTGKRIASGAEAKDLCLRQVISTVRWVDEEESLVRDGFQRALEVGPGTVLAGLWKSFSKDIPCLPAGKLEEIAKIAEG